ncbi:hypothetical protein SLEP1_g55277 [Rubroshorea leprosula]|uniref:Uncharacterized protein n=1 Tax=Rubroshorea leprosula TaxID=152421 RepID=A0AAV5MH14_9ROSI|nr:hypothetical protein SLEP1_g55277 [Rubroshorea leprosula]
MVTSSHPLHFGLGPNLSYTRDARQSSELRAYCTSAAELKAYRTSAAEFRAYRTSVAELRVYHTSATELRAYRTLVAELRVYRTSAICCKYMAATIDTPPSDHLSLPEHPFSRDLLRQNVTCAFNAVAPLRHVTFT